jgi:transcription initiation factor IIE alpha subunit
MDVILDSGIVSEEELESRLDYNLKKTNDILESFEKEHTLEVEEEVVEGMYYGPVGDC